jgi:hypothetical protein
MSSRFKLGDRVIHRSLPSRHSLSQTLGETKVTTGTVEQIKLKKNKRGQNIKYVVVKKDSNGAYEEYMPHRLELIEE